MPRAFLIKSRSAFPATRKENISPVNKHTDKNAQLTENLQQDSPSVDHELPTARISPANEVSDSSQYTTVRRGSLNTAIKDKQKEAVRVRSEISNYQEPNTKSNTRGRKRSKRVIEQEPKEFTDNHVSKKVRKGQPKKTVVYYYATPEDIKARERFEGHQAPAIKDEPKLMKNYTHEKRHHPNEYSRYPEQASQSHGMPSENSRRRAEQTGSFAMQNRLESIERGKTNSQQNNEGFDKNVGLENVMIVEYHSMSGNRDGSYRPRQQKSTQMVTQHPPQGYYPPPRSSPITSTNYVPTSSVTTTAPVQMPQPQRVPVQTIPKQEKETSSEPKVVYVPVYPVSQGPNGVIYEQIPNATPIMAKDTVHIPQGSAESRQIQQQQKQQQQQEQVRQVPQMVQAVPQRQDTIVYRKVQSPPVSEQKQRMEYRAYEPHIPQQLAAAPAPNPYQPHPQGHVLMQQQPAEGMKQSSSSAYPTQATTVMQVSPYPVNRPPHPHQYQPGLEQQQNRSYRPQHPTTLSAPPTTTDSQVQRYPAPRPTVTISQSYPEVPQQYGHYQRQSQTPMQHQGYQGERLVMQTVDPSYGPPVTKQQPIYQHRVSQPRPPPLPSQPQHAEKAALPSPSYPQESAKRLLTPRYTPDGMNDEQKFVYVSTPAEFMNSPVYRVPNKEGKFKTEIMHQSERAERVYHKNGSKKRKSSYPSHTVLYKSTQEDIPSPTDRNSRTPSPKETDLRCNERLVKSPNQPAALNKTSLVMTPPVSPTDREEDIETVTVVVRDQGIQASPRDERGMRIVEHTCYRRAITHMRSNSYHSESSEEDYLEDEMPYKKSESDNDTESHSSDKNMYTEDGTVVVHIPYPETGTSNKRHRTKRGNYRFICKFCSKGFQWHSHLESHERTHTGEKPFKCPECDRAFCRADGLQCHMLVHNKKRPFKCPYCGKGFNDKIVLEKHIYSHTGVKPFKCEYCGRAFSDSLSIEKHLLVHTGTKPYKCPYCVRSFNDSQMLVRHIRSHTGEKPFKCKHCPMAFSKQSALIIHTRVHTGEKPYQCSHCTKSFSISGNLQRHILIHTGERPYKCSKCPKAFNNPSHLSRHISKLHAPQPGAVRDQIKYEPFPDTGHMSNLHAPQPGAPNDQIKYEPFPDTGHMSKLHAPQPGPPNDQIKYELFSPDTEHINKLHVPQPGSPKDHMKNGTFPDTEHMSKLHVPQPGPPKDQMKYGTFPGTEHINKLHAPQPGPPKDQMKYEPFHDTVPIYRAQAVV